MQCYSSPLRGAAGWLAPRGPVGRSGSNTGPIIHSTLFADPRMDDGDTELEAKPALVLFDGFLCHRQGTKSQRRPIFQEPLRSHPQRDPRQPQLLSHNTYPPAYQSLTLSRWLSGSEYELWNHQLLICCVTWGK